MSICRSCSAEILWTVTVQGNAMPLDAAPHPDGNVRLTGRTARTTSGGSAPECEVTAGGQAAPFEDLAEDRYMPHHATCPQGEQWRQR